MSVQFQKPLVPLEWQAGHQRGSRCARAGHVSGYYGVAMQLAGHKRGSRCARAGHVSGYYGVAMQLNELLLLLYIIIILECKIKNQVKDSVNICIITYK